MQQTISNHTNTPKRILNQRDILASLGVSKTTLWRMINAGTFPTPLKLGERLNGWKVETFEQWLTTKGV
jgi:prophage regulatory protein